MGRSGSQFSGQNRNTMAVCAKCGTTIRSDNLPRHMLQHNEKIDCKFCKKGIRSDLLLKHETLCQSKVDESLCDRYTGASCIDDDDSQTSVSGFFRSHQLHITVSKDYDRILNTVCDAASTKLEEYVATHPVKAQIILKLTFYKERFGEREESDKVFRSICEPIQAGDDITEFLQRAKQYIRQRIVEYERLGSGWIYDKFHCAHLEVAKFNPLSASGKVKIPKLVKDMRSVLNITSNDNKCFLYAVAAGLMNSKGSLPTQSVNRYTNYVSRASRMTMDGVEFPVKMKDIPKVEVMNRISISVFQWCLEEECAIPLKHGSNIGTQIDLLYIEDDYTAHYLLIKEFNAFMRYRTKYHHSMFYCRKCLHGFTEKKNLREHSGRCVQGINQIVKMSNKGCIEYKGIHKMGMKPFVVYFDFECITAPYDTCASNPTKSSTIKYQKHMPAVFCIMTTSEIEAYKEETIIFSNENSELVTKHFMETLAGVHKRMMICLKKSSFKINMTDEDKKDFLSATHCYLCQKALEWGSNTNYPVRDHDHTKETENYRGAACNKCNRNFWNKRKRVPVIAHNMKGYDLNLFLRDLIKTADTISVIPETIEKFKAVYTDKFIFLDSLAFLSTSLEKLAQGLKQSGLENFHRLQKEFPENYDLLSEKGVYCYDYASSFSVFKETKLPPKTAFYNRLREEEISASDYSRACKVFEVTGCTNLLDYTELYVKTDTAILCDVFQNFRRLCMSYYNLDSCQYISLPSFAWDAMLKMTSVKIEVIADIDVYTFIEANLRGGVTTINHRHFKANNQYLGDYNGLKPSTYIHYIDVNNLYGKGMELPLPTGNYRWLLQDEINSLDVLKLNPDGDKSYILEVDLEYPRLIHDLHSDYPLAVQSRFISETELSPHNQEFLRKNAEKFRSTRKLCPDLHNKEKYVCSLRTLQLFLQQGLQLQHIHRVLTADQSCFLQPYIKFNSEKRLASKNQFESDFFKLANNAIYGKFIESVRNRTSVDIVTDNKKAKKLTSKPQFKGFQILDENVTIVQSVKKTITLDKPIACGFTVLENAKHIMGAFWYETLKPLYGDKIKLLLSDTDSLIYAVQTENGYRDLYDIREKMDLSGYAQGTPLSEFHDSTNKKVPGKFSDERPQEIIQEVIALKPKMYSLLTRKLVCQDSRNPSHTCNDGCSQAHSVTAKGITKVAQRFITHEDYRRCLEFRSTDGASGTTMTSSRTIRAINHELYSIAIQKRGLSAYDDKKYVCDDGISTLSYGHYKLR